MSAAAPPDRYGLLPIGGGRRPAPCPNPGPAEAWWAMASNGHWRPRAVSLPPVLLDHDPARWCAGGGMGPGPANAAMLVRQALLALPAEHATMCPEHLVVVVAAAPLAPHAWRIAEGGVAVAPGRWVRRYAALPAEASLGAWAHEMAHLLLDWPDLPGSPGLMGPGAARDGGRDPAPPEPALAVARGWIEVLGPDPALAAGALRQDQAMALDWAGRRLLLTAREESFALHDRHAPGAPLATGRIADAAAPLLGTAAPVLWALRDAAG